MMHYGNGDKSNGEVWKPVLVHRVVLFCSDVHFFPDPWCTMVHNRHTWNHG